MRCWSTNMSSTARIVRVMERSQILFVLLAGFVLVPLDANAQSPAGQQVIEGRARIVDGDTLEIGPQLVDLYGIDAPEQRQTCEREGKPWGCGMEATYAMAALLETHWLTCHPQAIGAAGNIEAVCRLGGPKGISVNRRFVRQGWALALPETGRDYVRAQQDAEAAKAGLWSGAFVAPWEWRRTAETGTTGR